MVHVELVYVAADQTIFQVRLNLPTGATIEDAIRESGLETKYPESKGMPVGIYSKQLPLNTVLTEGCRVEIYRPLTQDPKDKRRIKARQG